MNAYNEEFNKNLSDLFTGCRERTLQELKQKEEYAQMNRYGIELLTNLRNNLTPENNQLLENYLENENLIRGIELDTVFLSGASALYQIKKRINPLTKENEKFTNEIIKDCHLY